MAPVTARDTLEQSLRGGGRQHGVTIMVREWNQWLQGTPLNSPWRTQQPGVTIMIREWNQWLQGTPLYTHWGMTQTRRYNYGKEMEPVTASETHEQSLGGPNNPTYHYGEEFVKVLLSSHWLGPNNPVVQSWCVPWKTWGNAIHLGLHRGCARISLRQVSIKIEQLILENSCKVMKWLP